MTSKAQKIIRRTAIGFAILPLTPVFVWLGVLWAVPALTSYVQFFAVYGYFISWPLAVALGLVDIGMTISNRNASKGSTNSSLLSEVVEAQEVLSK